MRVLRAEHHPAREGLPGRGQRRERRGRGRILDVAVPLAREPEQLSQPVHRHQLELGGRRRRGPEDLRHVQRRCEQLREDARLRARRREIGEETRMLPMRYPRQQHLVEVAEHRRERLAGLRRKLRQRAPDLAGFHLRQYRQLTHPFEVRGRPLERLRAVVAKTQPSSFLIWGQVRVFSTCSFVSQARRAWPTPSSGYASARVECASLEIESRTPASPAARACASRRSSRSGWELISRNVFVASAVSNTRERSMSAGPRRLILRAVRWPMQSTFGFSIAEITRSVGFLSKAVCSEATTQSRPASVSSSTSSEPSARMFTSMPLSSLKRPSVSFSASISRSCASSRPSRR